MFTLIKKNPKTFKKVTGLLYPDMTQIHGHAARPRFVINENFSVTISYGKSCEHKFAIKKGRETDYASIPRILWCLYAPLGDHSVAALVHDELYRRQTGCDRFYADAIFRMVMIKYEVPWLKRVLMYYAVRFFGSWGYQTQ